MDGGAGCDVMKEAKPLGGQVIAGGEGLLLLAQMTVGAKVPHLCPKPGFNANISSTVGNFRPCRLYICLLGLLVATYAYGSQVSTLGRGKWPFTISHV
jgi:hypothetical protein